MIIGEVSRSSMTLVVSHAGVRVKVRTVMNQSIHFLSDSHLQHRSGTKDDLEMCYFEEPSLLNICEDGLFLGLLCISMYL